MARKNESKSAKADTTSTNDAPMRTWYVGIAVTEGEGDAAKERVVWRKVEAQGMRRAAKQARKEQPGSLVAVSLEVGKGMTIGKDEQA